MELGAEISQKVKKTIKKQLQTLGCYVDDELPEYIMVMIANKRTKCQMVEDLYLFLNDEAEKFVSWLFIMLERIQQAMQLPDIDALMEDDKNDEKKKKKQNKKEKVISEDSDIDDNQKHGKSHEKGKRRFSEKNLSDDEEKKKRKKEDDEKEKRRIEREERHGARQGKERDEREKDRQKREEDRKQTEEERKKKQKEREEEIQKHRKEKEQGNKEERERREIRDKKRNSDPDSRIERRSKRQSSPVAKRPRSKENGQDEDIDVRKEAEVEAKKIEKRSEKNHNPMDFVKKIAKDINKRVMGSNMKSEKKTEMHDVKNLKDETIEHNGTQVEKDELTTNISLQAVSQYGEGDAENDKHTSRSSPRIKRSHSKSQPKRNICTYRKSISPTKTTSQRKRSSRSTTRHRSRSRHRSGSRNYQSTLKQRSASRSRHRSHSHDALAKHSKDRGRSRSKGRQSHHKSTQSRGRPSHRTRSRSKVSPADKSKARSSERKDFGTGDLRKFIDPDSEEDKKKNIPSQIKVYTDFKRKPSLSNSHQASSALLKRAVTEAVIVQPQVNQGNEEEIELHYTENIDDVLHRPEVRMVMPPTSSGERRVILDDVGDNLATITVNIKTNAECDSRRSGRRSLEKTRNDRNYKDDESKGRLGKDRGVVDARYALMKSKDNISDGQKVEKIITNKQSRSRDRFLGSMVADLEEKSHQRKHALERSMSWKQRRELTQEQRKRDLQQNRERCVADSSDDEVHNAHHARKLKEEALRIKEREERRERHLSQTGDLRNLLRRKKEKKSDSENEDEIARKLREKIKEEKHKKLFGVLNDEDKFRLKRERDELRQKLKILSSKKISQSQREQRSSRKDRQELYSETKTEPEKEAEQEPEEEDEEEWVEGNVNENETNSDDQENKEVEKDSCDKKKVEKGKDDQLSNDDEEGKIIGKEEQVEEQEEREEEEEDEEEEGERDGRDQVEEDQEGNEEDKEGSEENEDEDEKIDCVEEDGKMKDEDSRDHNQDQVSDNDNADNDVETNNSDDVVSQETILNSMHQDDNADTFLCQQKDSGKRRHGKTTQNASNTGTSKTSNSVSQDIILTSMHQEDIVPDKYQMKRSSKKAPGKRHNAKRRHTHHEFVVTLDGIENGKQKRLPIQPDASSRRSFTSSKREKSISPTNLDTKTTDFTDKSAVDDLKREKSSSLTQSDEEFERILKEKEKQKLEKNPKRQRSKEKVSSHRRHRYHHKRSSGYDGKLSKVDKEILLAEKKLATQKLLKKSLDQVQSLDNLIFSSTKPEQFLPKTAYINPHFQRKDIISNLESLNSSIAVHNTQATAVALPSNISNEHANVTEVQKLSYTPHLIATSTSTTATIQPNSQLLITIPKISQPMVDLPKLSPTSIPTSVAIQASLSDAEKPVKVAPTSPVKTASVSVPARVTIQERCSFWPDCKNITCQYIHPSSPCNIFPNCSFGDRCAFIHPKCKFGDRCTNNECIYSHTASSSGFQSQLCKFGSNCTKMDCAFKHPVLKPCRFGTTCTNSECLYLHEKPVAVVNPSQLKWVAGKPRVSERKFAVEEAIVSKTPISIETSKDR